MKRIILLSAAAAVFSTPAWSAGHIKPGEYTVTSTAYNETEPTKESSFCFSAEEAEDLEKTLREQLDIWPENDSEALDVKIYNDEHFSTDITFAANSQEPLTMIWEGRWVGECPS